MLINYKLKKLGFKKEDLDKMKISDIIKLGEMGYTKEEIENLEKAPENNFDTEIEALKAEIKELKKNNEVDNVRDKATDNVDSIEDVVADTLKKLGGVAENE